MLFTSYSKSALSSQTPASEPNSSSRRRHKAGIPKQAHQGMTDEYAADAPRHQRVDDRTRIFQRTGKVARMQTKLVINRLKGSPESRILKYCSPIRKLTPTACHGDAESSASGIGQERTNGFQQRRNHTDAEQQSAQTHAEYHDGLRKEHAFQAAARNQNGQMSLNASPSSLYPL